MPPHPVKLMANTAGLSTPPKWQAANGSVQRCGPVQTFATAPVCEAGKTNEMEKFQNLPHAPPSYSIFKRVGIAMRFSVGLPHGIPQPSWASEALRFRTGTWDWATKHQMGSDSILRFRSTKWDPIRGRAVLAISVTLGQVS